LINRNVILWHFDPEKRPFDCLGEFIHPDGRFSSPRGCLIGLDREPKRQDKQKISTNDEPCGVLRVIPHVVGGILDRLCGVVHTFLGIKVLYLPFFAALAGIGGALIFDNFNQERNRKRLGWFLLLISPLIGTACLVLGLP